MSRLEVWRPISSTRVSSLPLPRKLICVVEPDGSLRPQGSSSFAEMTRYRWILLSFLLVIPPYLINGAPTTTPVSLPADDTLSPYYCNDSPAWSGPSFFPKNCATALSQFFLNELLVHGDVLFEFLAVGGQRRSRFPPQQTPQKFTYGELPVHESARICPRRDNAHSLPRGVRDG